MLSNNCCNKNEKTFRQLALVNNVTPILVTDTSNAQDTILKGIEIAKQKGYITNGDTVAIAGGEKALVNYNSSDMNRTIGGVVRV